MIHKIFRGKLEDGLSKMCVNFYRNSLHVYKNKILNNHIHCLTITTPIISIILIIPLVLNLNLLNLLLNTTLLLNTNARFQEPVHKLGGRTVEVDKCGEKISNTEEDQRNKHRLSSVMKLIRGESKKRRNNGTTNDGSNDDSRSGLGVTSQSSNTQSEDGRETDRLKEVNSHEHGNSGISTSSHSSGTETDDTGEESNKHLTGLEELHQKSSSETTDSETSLSGSKEVRSHSVRSTRMDFSSVVNEVSCNRNLGSDVTELRQSSNPKKPLLLKGLLLEDTRVLGLSSHVCIGDLGNVGQEENTGEDKDEDSDSQVNPLNGSQVTVIDVLEEDLSGEDRSDDGSDGLNGLREVETHLGVLGRSTDGEVGVAGRLESSKSGSDDEGCSAESSEGSLSCGGPEEKCSDTVESEAEHEGGFVSVVLEDPAGVGEGGNGVGSGR
jgi:hypothetical protein